MALFRANTSYMVVPASLIVIVSSCYPHHAKLQPSPRPIDEFTDMLPKVYICTGLNYPKEPKRLLPMRYVIPAATSLFDESY